MTPICATFSDFRLVKGRKVCQLVCEVPLEQADAALIALGGLPNPHAERWVGIVPLKAQPQGQDNSGSAPSPSADAADSPAAAPLPRCNRLKCGIHRVLTEPTTEIFACTEPDCDRSIHALSSSGDAKPAKPKRPWHEYSPSQQAGMMCESPDFGAWLGKNMPLHRWDKQHCSAGGMDANKPLVPQLVRWYCGVSSRSELDTNPEAAKRWRELHSMFTADTQYGDRR